MEDVGFEIRLKGGVEKGDWENNSPVMGGFYFVHFFFHRLVFGLAPLAFLSPLFTL